MTQPRKRSRSAEQTRKAVLRAAIRLFARSGFAGVSMRDISQACGVSQPLIHHHFGSKKDLYVATHEQAVRSCRDKMGPTLAGRRGNKEMLLKAVERYFSVVGASRTMRRLCAWSLLEGDLSPWPGEAELFQEVRGQIEEAQQDGSIRSDVQSSFLAVTAFCMVRHWWEYRDLYAAYLGAASAEKDRIESRPIDVAYIEQAVRFLGTALAKQD